LNVARRDEPVGRLMASSDRVAYLSRAHINVHKAGDVSRERCSSDVHFGTRARKSAPFGTVNDRQRATRSIRSNESFENVTGKRGRMVGTNHVRLHGNPVTSTGVVVLE